MRSLLLVSLLLAAPLAGCIGGDDPVVTTAGPDEPQLNPWQAGLDDHYPTPDHVETRSADERRANVAPPGDPEFAPFDAAMTTWMTDHDVPAGQLALMKDGQLRYLQGYGYTDRNETQPTDGETMLRIASITKPITSAVVHGQAEQGLYNLTDPVFCLPPDPAPNCRLPIEPHADRPVADDRLAEITVQHLLDHTGGWDRTISGDTMFMTFEVAEDLGIESPPAAWKFAQWTLGAELDHDPGTTQAYSNLGYVLAGLVAEAATGAELGALYDAYIFRPLEIERDIEPGHTLPEWRNPREPFYHCPYEAPNVYDPDEEVCGPDGTWSMEAILANGGLIATAEAVAAVYEAYGHLAWPTDWPPGPATWNFHGGGMPGTSGFAADVADGSEVTGDLQIVFLFNKRDTAQRCDLPGPADDQGPFCGRSHLEWTMMELAQTWGAGS